MSDQVFMNGQAHISIHAQHGRLAASQQTHNIPTPHEHDVLSGRGNFVNYHAGNEHFRALVKKHKMSYVACPKPQKGKFSRMIVDEIKHRDPPGRFLKQDPDTKLWHDIGDKKALDKTRQALREGAPELLKEIDGDGVDDIGTQQPVKQSSFGGGVGGAGGFAALAAAGAQSTSNYSRVSMPPPPVVVPSGGTSGFSSGNSRGIDAGGRVVPGMGDTTIPLSGSSVSDYNKGLQNMFQIEQFEPTPLAPNASVKLRGRSISPKRPGLDRSDSLEFGEIFDKKDGSESEKGEGKKDGKKSMHGSHMSAMSFSIGNMSEATDLSAVFEDSMRISDKHLPEKVKSSNSPTPNNQHNMSYATFSEADSVGLGNSIMNMSISKGFHDSADSSDSLANIKKETV